MQRFQHGLEPLFTAQFYPFLYPPTFLLVLWPLGHLGYEAARVAWAGGTLLLFLFAVLAPKWRPGLLLAALVAPATIVSLIYGQNGFLTAALMIGGLRSVRTRPVLAGVLLGLLAYKPQLAILVPVALVAGGHGRALLAAAATVAVVAASASIAFGPALWREWLDAGAAQWPMVQAFAAGHDQLVPTVTAAAHLLGLDLEAAAAAQLLAALAAAAAVWTCWRRDGGGALAIAAVPTATLLATPYAFVYDLPMVAGAILLIVSEVPLTPPSMLILALALELPQLMFTSPLAILPLGAPVLGMLLWWTVRRSHHCVARA